MKNLSLLIIVVVLSSCINDIEITSEYIINKNWDSQYNNAIIIQKMISDDGLDIFAEDFDSWSLRNKLQLDTTFTCSYHGLNAFDKNRPKLKEKVYFNKNNGWNWSVNGEKRSTIGKLVPDNWYKFSSLTMNTKYYVYVFVDSLGHVHDFKFNEANY